MSANPPPFEGPTNQPTALSALFRRLASEPPVPPMPPPRRSRSSRSATPELLGFTESFDPPYSGSPARYDSDPAIAMGSEFVDPVDFDVGEVADEPARPPPPPPMRPLAYPAPPPAQRPLAHLAPGAQQRPLAHLAPPAQQRPLGHLARTGGRPAEPTPPRAFHAEAVAPLGRLARPDEVWPLPRSVGPEQPPPPQAAPEPPPPPAPQPAAAASRPAGALRTAAQATARAPREPAAVTALAPAPERGGRQAMPRNRRLHRRIKLAADIDVDSVPCSLIDLSIGGFAASGAPPVAPNTVVPITLRLTIDGIEVGTQLGARIIYANEVRAGGRFVDLTPSQTAFLRYVVTWRGESVGPVGATTLLDAISGGADRIAAEAAVAAAADAPADAPRERWWVGLVGRKIKPPR